ncbi:MAG: M3 family metallopeptidase [Burkholderiales bacterium]
MNTMNPLLDFSGLPRYRSVTSDHITPAVDALLAECRAADARLTASDVPATWKDFVEPLADVHERLERAWGVVGHLHGVLDTPLLREAYNANQPKVVDYYTELGQNLALFEKYKALRAATEYTRLSAPQQRIIDHAIRDFRLSGAELPADKKAQFAQIQAELAKLQTRFSENVLDATNAFNKVIERKEDLAGIPDDVLEGFKAAAERDGKTGWKLSLQLPSYLPVMQYAENRSLREELYRAHATRAAEFGKSELDNTPLIRRILELRDDEAKLLGYRDFAEVSLVPKMAQSPAQVLSFLRDLADKSLPYARRDVEELRSFARNELGLNQMESWDIPFVSEKLRAKRYAFSEQEVKQYFPEHKVLEGMFRVVETLYGIAIEPDQAETWDPNVRFFKVRARDSATIGQFYLDPYARETKRGGAWMDEALCRRRIAGGVQTPVAYLVCNFSSPVGGKPALLTHDDVNTLFHEFGHGLHHLLTRVDEGQVSGIRGVEWDAVELPSQFMENFCWEWEVLRHMTAHVDTGEALPKPLFEKMVAAKNFQSGMGTVRQIELAMFDMLIHTQFDPRGTKTPLELLGEVRAQVAVVHPPAYNRFPNSFGHVFSGGYSAGYYSYKWAEVLSADAYSLFEENGVLDPATGERFWNEILAVGGSRAALDSFKAFRGREPNVEALLRHNGMVPA